MFFKDSEQNWTKSLEDKEIPYFIQSGLPYLEAFFSTLFKVLWFSSSLAFSADYDAKSLQDMNSIGQF